MKIIKALQKSRTRLWYLLEGQEVKLQLIFWFTCIFVLEKPSDRETNMNLPSTIKLPKCSQQPEMDQPKTKSPKLYFNCP